MRGRVDMRRVVHAGRDALRQHPRLRHVMDTLDLDVFEVRPVRRLKAEAMRQVVELQPHFVVGVGLEVDAADFDHLDFLPTPAVVVPRRSVPYCGTTVSYIGRNCKAPRAVNFLQRDNPRTVFEGQRFCETMRFSNSDFVSISRRAIIRYSSLKRWLGTGTEIAT